MQHVHRRWFPFWLACAAFPALGAPRPAVVELYTSEGCSSCPPAETYLGELAKRPDVLALSFHVDYWDGLGWRDRYALPEAVQRQRAYARTLHLSSVFTPQVIVDGTSSVVGSDRGAIDKALATTRSGVPIQLSAPGTNIGIDVPVQSGADLCDVVLVSFVRSAVTPIGRGENAGRTLTEFNIVRNLRVIGTWDGHAAHYQISRDLLAREASDAAILLQRRGDSVIIGAGTLRLP
jgi:hypothetical protein